MNRGVTNLFFVAALSAATVATVAFAADVSGEKKNEISAAEAADREAEERTKKLLEQKRKEMSAAEAADQAAEAASGTDSKKNEISAAEAADQAAEEAAKADAASAPPAGNRSLAEAVKAPKGTLKNPYTDDPKAIAEGKQLYLDYSCNGCHGGTGGGGMCPPLTNERFVYGSNDDVIFRLIAMGSDKLQAAGYSRIATETVKGPMPGYEDIIETEEELWKIIAFVRSVYRGRDKKRDW